MSHFTKVKTKINSLPAFIAALDKLGLRYTVGVGQPAIVSGYMHQTIEAEISIHVVRGYDIGVVKGMDGNYELAGDWWGLESFTGRTEREHVDKIARAYSLERVTMACKEAGYEFEQAPAWNEETQEAEMVACRWS